MSNTNPYVGPRTFQKDEGHLFFGRDREARDLLTLIATEQLVLFYAQSGAGKSSLINTRVIPALEAKKFEVLPVGRVTGENLARKKIGNIYIFNLICSLIQQGMNSDNLINCRLEDFLQGFKKVEEGYIFDAAHSPDDSNHRRVLIVDQFEELFTTHPEAWKLREDFFIQLGDAMEKDPLLWIVLVMREDYIAHLDPYAHLVQNGLRVRYYMQRLNREAALQAIKKPVENLRPYEDGVAEKLVDDLRGVQVGYKPD